MLSKLDRIWRDRDNYIDGRELSEKLAKIVQTTKRELMEAPLSDMGLAVARFDDRMQQFRSDAAAFVISKARRG